MTWPGPIPKPKLYNPKKARAKLKAAVLPTTREAVWERSGGRCELCRDTEVMTARAGYKGSHELHEAWITRAEGRGLDPRLVFSEWNCCRLCPPCHLAVTEHRVRLAPAAYSAWSREWPDRAWKYGCEQGVYAVTGATYPPLPERIAHSRSWLMANGRAI